LRPSRGWIGRTGAGAVLGLVLLVERGPAQHGPHHRTRTSRLQPHARTASYEIRLISSVVIAGLDPVIPL
jgi:hypothetical protein